MLAQTGEYFRSTPSDIILRLWAFVTPHSDNMADVTVPLDIALKQCLMNAMASRAAGPRRRGAGSYGTVITGVRWVQAVITSSPTLQHSGVQYTAQNLKNLHPESVYHHTSPMFPVPKTEARAPHTGPGWNVTSIVAQQASNT